MVPWWRIKRVPFAAPPVGNLRWRAPKPAAVWQGVLQPWRARVFGAPRIEQGVDRNASGNYGTLDQIAALQMSNKEH
jgi:para-nitrobenzyl esterase